MRNSYQAQTRHPVLMLRKRPTGWNRVVGIVRKEHVLGLIKLAKKKSRLGRS